MTHHLMERIVCTAHDLNPTRQVCVPIVRQVALPVGLHATLTLKTRLTQSRGLVSCKVPPPSLTHHQTCSTAADAAASGGLSVRLFYLVKCSEVLRARLSPPVKRR